MIYATGDTHGNFQRFKPKYFPAQADMDRDDYVIICGDFGGVWSGEEQDGAMLDWLERLPFTTLFVSGNHENFDLLKQYPVEKWQGGNIQRIRPHVIHLLRGQVFSLAGYTFFTMGGARSHDIEDGILEPNAAGFAEQYLRLRRRNAQFRIDHQSWWQEEMPSAEEYAAARRNLAKHDHKVDYIVTHCAPSRIQAKLSSGYARDELTEFFEEILPKTQFYYWLFGHYHDNKIIDNRFVLL